MLDYIRIACAVPPVQVGDTEKNAQDICAYLQKAEQAETDLLLFPELSLTGYTCGDLFLQDTLFDGVKAALRDILKSSALCPNLTAVIGFPLRMRNRLYNCAGVIRGGKLLSVVPKTYLPDGESRWFTSGKGVDAALPAEALGLTGEAIPFGQRLLQLGNETVLGVEICEDLMTPAPVSADLAISGAEVILNLSAAPESAGKRDSRRELVKHQSAGCSCVYAFCSAGSTESTSDKVYSGHSIIGENGRLLAESAAQDTTDYLLIADCDLGRVRADRRKNRYFGENPRIPVLEISCGGLRCDGANYPAQKLPFLPGDEESRQAYCMEIFRLQVLGLKRRLQVIGAKAVIGISGGLDSTLALLVAVEAMRQLGRPLTDVHGVTMPCFGTSDRTYQNSWKLMQDLGITSKEINIKNAVNLHFADIGHDSSVHNGTYENSQARERTQILMDYSGMVGGIVVGTGDLSELALGWCTYNGDHMSMYGVNASVPKTLISRVIAEVAKQPQFSQAQATLADILDTPISPELLPPDAQGNISQQTEDLVGPYILHDFFLYHMLGYGFTPEKIYRLACSVFREDFDGETVKKWLKTFCRRFFTQQFKRNCMPDGAKVDNLGLSPRGDWMMPSDAAGSLWLKEIDNL